MPAAKKLLFAAASMLALAACGGSESTQPPPVTTPTTPDPPATSPLFKPELRMLTASDVETVVAQAVSEAGARGAPATIAIVDRVGNVLAIFQMNGAAPTTFVREGPAGTPNTSLQGVEVPSTLAAISKAITGAYLSSGGNAFSTRTASQIVQEHFPPAPTTVGLESGPLFGVQFSQLPCSDLNTRAIGGGPTIGPQRAPLGLAADPGGFPLYKDGFVVGGIGIITDDDYGFDPNILDVDDSDEEAIAWAGTSGFAAPATIRANRISVDGTTLRFSDTTDADLMSNPGAAPSFASIAGGVQGDLIDVTSYFDGASGGGVYAGVSYGAEGSGIREATPAEYSNSDIFVLTDGAGTNRYPATGGTDGASVASPLTAAEVTVLLEEAFDIMTRARGQIRQPLNSRAQVSISIVDTNGQILGIVRGPDAPIFGTDVSLQKARTAAFFTNEIAASDLTGTPGPSIAGFNTTKSVASYLQDVRDFIPDPTALTGTFAFADRSGGNISRPYFPDGEVGTANGPLSLPITEWNIFATGLQTSLVVDNILEHVVHVVTSGGSSDTAPACSALPDIPTLGGTQNRLQNGIQIFPGSVPIYRGDILVGGIGVSGDGIDQDDMISFLGVHNAAERLGGAINNAPEAIRADQIVISVNGAPVRLRYINCPFNPFVGSDEQNVCQGK
ncbi:heme-binding protein [Hyphococcus flavus]|uniref:Heme-binding protein n=1 Tax=Hyphococcus flavus TaxID=1866326 RepID=A0AAE9ZJ07_9PROT|nr:heme-binding protein [Hyphococcus flavus]WDI31305.1 heme-binding protein [Hyphococcus flavus]